MSFDEETTGSRFQIWRAIAYAGFSGVLSFVSLLFWIVVCETQHLRIDWGSFGETLWNSLSDWWLPLAHVSNMIAAGVFGSTLPAGPRRPMMGNILIVGCMSNVCMMWP